jgi:hypothetical protein
VRVFNDEDAGAGLDILLVVELFVELVVAVMDDIDVTDVIDEIRGIGLEGIDAL